MEQLKIHSCLGPPPTPYLLPSLTPPPLVALPPLYYHHHAPSSWAASGPRRFSNGWRRVGDHKDRWQEMKGKGLRIHSMLEDDMATRTQFRKRTGVAGGVWGKRPSIAWTQTG
jgi:hypothetical protein